jgi:hypothetical protein
MSYMFELYYRAPPDLAREERLIQQAAGYGGRRDYREDPSEGSPSQAVVLTFEFDDENSAHQAAEHFRQSGEHVEGIGEYG